MKDLQFQLNLLSSRPVLQQAGHKLVICRPLVFLIFEEIPLNGNDQMINLRRIFCSGISRTTMVVTRRTTNSNNGGG